MFYDVAMPDTSAGWRAEENKEAGSGSSEQYYYAVRCTRAVSSVARSGGGPRKLEGFASCPRLQLWVREGENSDCAATPRTRSQPPKTA